MEDRAVYERGGFRLVRQSRGEGPAAPVVYQVFGASGEPLDRKFATTEEKGRKILDKLADEAEEGEIEPDRPDPNQSLSRALSWNINVQREQRSVFELHRRWKRGELILRPEFQRDSVWKTENKARLVESVLLRLPIPAVYVARERVASGERDIVIDGQQRLGALFEFLENGYSLRGFLELLPTEEFGQKFQALDLSHQRRIEDYSLPVMTLEEGTDPAVKFRLFERLNRGGVSLNAQEIRNGLYRGPGLELVHRLGAEGGVFRVAGGVRRAWGRMLADQLVLRVLAFMLSSTNPYAGDMEVFLNQALERMNRMSQEELARIERRFYTTMEAVVRVFGPDAFRRATPSGERTRFLNSALMDTLCHGFSSREEPTDFWAVPARRAALVRSLDRLWSEPEFQETLTLGTSDVRRVQHRLRRWAREVELAAQL